MSVAAAVLLWVICAFVLIVGGLVLFTLWTARRVEAALPPQGRFMDVAGARLHYLDTGRGPDVVMIHGLGGQMRNFTHSLVARGERRISRDRRGPARFRLLDEGRGNLRTPERAGRRRRRTHSFA